MDSEKIYSYILDISKENKISRPYVVGGIPRDLVSDNPANYMDIDITTNYSDVVRLGMLFADKLKVGFEIFKDGHISVFLKGYSVDFSSNYISEDAIEYNSKEIGNDDFLKEVYSRDFTINTLLIDLETKDILDPTGMGKSDISEKVIRTVSSPEITFLDDPNRIFRAIELATRMNFSLHKDIVDFLVNNSDLIINDLDIKDAYIESSIAKSLTNNPEKTLELLLELNLLKAVPLTGSFKNELIKRRMIKQYLD